MIKILFLLPFSRSLFITLGMELGMDAKTAIHHTKKKHFRYMAALLMATLSAEGYTQTFIHMYVYVYMSMGRLRAL